MLRYRDRSCKPIYYDMQGVKVNLMNLGRLSLRDLSQRAPAPFPMLQHWIVLNQVAIRFNLSRDKLDSNQVTNNNLYHLYRQLYKHSGLNFDTLEEQAIALNKSIKMFNYIEKKYQL